MAEAEEEEQVTDSLPLGCETARMSRTEFVPGEVLIRRPGTDIPRNGNVNRWVLQDSDDVVLASLRANLSSYTIMISEHTYRCRKQVFRSGLSVINRRNGEPVLETRCSRPRDEPIKFRGHDLRYSITRGERRNRWHLPVGDNVVMPRTLTITDGSLTALTITSTNSMMHAVHAIVGPAALRSDTPLIASVGFALLEWATAARRGHA
jgi:hypothetical protein